YQRVEIGENFETPAGKDHTNPVIALMESYAATVKKEDFLSKHPRQKHPVQIELPNSRYVGSERCKTCHKHAYEIWENEKGLKTLAPHARAYERLVTEAKRPSNRQFDPECITCHVVGYKYQTGFTSLDEKQPAKQLEMNRKLTGVGCESCHGPASEHVKN